MLSSPSTEFGSLGICHLKRLWSATIASRDGEHIERGNEALLDKLLLNALGLGMSQTFQHLYSEAPDFDSFEQWVVSTAGHPDALQIERFNTVIHGGPHSKAVQEWLDAVDNREPVFTEAELKTWQERGFIVLKNAVPEEAREAAAKTIWETIGASPDDPESWYGLNCPRLHGIMLELIQHPALAATRRSLRIHKAFAQLWGTADLWTTADRCGFHPPQRERHPFQGPDLHWDVNFDLPLEFSTQGILYLTDTPAEQGALTLVPGFHRRIEHWLAALPPGEDPQQQDLHALGSTAIGAEAGDMVIWHQLLPHGSRPNLGERPRIVQYINMLPGPALANAA